MKNLTPFTQNLTPFTQNLKPFTQNLTPFTQNLTPFTPYALRPSGSVASVVRAAVLIRFYAFLCGRPTHEARRTRIETAALATEEARVARRRCEAPLDPHGCTRYA